MLKNEKDREEMLKEKYNTESISAHERRELQQLILKKPELGTEDQEWLSKLRLKKKLEKLLTNININKSF